MLPLRYTHTGAQGLRKRMGSQKEMQGNELQARQQPGVYVVERSVLELDQNGQECTQVEGDPYGFFKLFLLWKPRKERRTHSSSVKTQLCCVLEDHLQK